MQTIRFVRRACVAALVCVGASAGATTTTDPSASKSIPYEFCVSGQAKNAKVYISPTFQNPLHDVHEAFAGYLGNSHGFRVDAHCYTLPSKELADEFRDQRIQILHWDGLDHVVATPWKPAVDTLTTPESVVVR